MSKIKKTFYVVKKESLTKLPTRKTWLDKKSERSNERENGDVSEWK